MSPLAWPDERADPAPAPFFAHAGSNLCLDFHGDPARAGLVVFSDGNHHMALGDCLAQFRSTHSQLEDVFYVTTPPRVAVETHRAGKLRIGNLVLKTAPHVFISPPEVLESLALSHRPLARGRGNTLLVQAGNPKAIRGVPDLARDDVRLFLSNPHTEAVSYRLYAQTLERLAARMGVAPPRNPVYGEAIHHREAPQFVADGRTDAAIVFHHLALRYMRIFPGRFEVVPLTEEGDPDNLRGDTHIALVGDGGAWGARALAFLCGPQGQDVYARHGLEPIAAT